MFEKPIKVSDIGPKGVVLHDVMSGAWLTALGDQDPNGWHFTQVEADIEVKRTGKDVEVKARGKQTGHVNCSRCLEKFDFSDVFKFKRVLLPCKNQTNDQESPDDEGNTYQDDKIVLADLLREHLLLSLPFAPVCNPDCLGLCPSCGTDLNKSECDCEKQPRGALANAIKQLSLKTED